MNDPEAQTGAQKLNPEPLPESAASDPTSPQEMPMKDSWGPFKAGELFPYKGYWFKFMAFSEQGFVVMPVKRTKKGS